jgi:hypothetical protein
MKINYESISIVNEKLILDEKEDKMLQDVQRLMLDIKGDIPSCDGQIYKLADEIFDKIYVLYTLVEFEDEGE